MAPSRLGCFARWRGTPGGEQILISRTEQDVGIGRAFARKDDAGRGLHSLGLFLGSEDQGNHAAPSSSAAASLPDQRNQLQSSSGAFYAEGRKMATSRPTEELLLQNLMLEWKRKSCAYWRRAADTPQEKICTTGGLVSAPACMEITKCSEKFCRSC